MTEVAASTPDAQLAPSLDRLLGDVCGVEAVEEAERVGWCAPVWDALAEAGYPWVSLPEDDDGSGGSLADAFEVIRAVGRHAAPVPLAETAVLGGWLSVAAGLRLPSGPLTVVPDPRSLTVEGGRVKGTAVVPWARRADAVVALVEATDGWTVVRAHPDQLRIDPRTDMAGEPRDDVVFDLPLAELESRPAGPGVDAATFRLRGCLTRVALSAGALAAMAQLTVDYTNERHQFGRPVAAFQAVQHHLVTVAESAVRASMASDVAVRALQHGRGPSFEVAAARVVVDAAVVDATRAAHQAHGAMGVTREYRLQQFSRRLWAWRHEYGSAREWRRTLGREVAAGGADGLFPTVTR